MSIIAEAKSEVEQLIKDTDPEIFKYHNFSHTEDVVIAVEEIIASTNLSEDEEEVVLIAAWFHDAGYSVNYYNHEEHSKQLARKFLEERNWADDRIKHVETCIESTRFPQMPTDKLSEILCDADMSHMKDSSFLEKSDNLRKELSAINKINIKKKMFCKKTMVFMEDQKYFTEYARLNFEPGKMQNRIDILKMAEEKDNNNKTLIKKQQDKIKKMEEKLAKKSAPERGVESMFRMTARSQINLSSMADNKANILITVNSIIISALASFIQRIVAQNGEMLIPMLIILCTSLLTMIYAILSTRPKLSSGVFTKDELKAKKINLMFFGNFYKMKFDEYEWAVKEMMKDYDGLYSNMIKDQYSLGVVLATKYNRIRKAYNIFMYGLITFVVSIIIVQLINI